MFPLKLKIQKMIFLVLHLQDTRSARKKSKFFMESSTVASIKLKIKKRRNMVCHLSSNAKHGFRHKKNTFLKKNVQKESKRAFYLVPVDFQTGGKWNFMDPAAWLKEDSTFEHRDVSILEYRMRYGCPETCPDWSRNHHVLNVSRSYTGGNQNILNPEAQRPRTA